MIRPNFYSESPEDQSDWDDLTQFEWTPARRWTLRTFVIALCAMLLGCLSVGLAGGIGSAYYYEPRWLRIPNTGADFVFWFGVLCWAFSFGAWIAFVVLLFHPLRAVEKEPTD